MSKKDRPLFRRRDRIRLVVDKAQALNKKLVATAERMFTVSALWFDRRRKEWIVHVEGGFRFLARFFERVAT